VIGITWTVAKQKGERIARDKRFQSVHRTIRWQRKWNSSRIAERPVWRAQVSLALRLPVHLRHPQA